MSKVVCASEKRKESPETVRFLAGLGVSPSSQTPLPAFGGATKRLLK
jgi:hypothetical protein